MAASDPKNVQVRRGIGVELGLIGELTMEVRSPAESIPILEHAVAAFDSLPGPPSLQIRYGRAVLAKAYERIGQRDQAKRLYGRSVPELQDLRSRDSCREWKRNWRMRLQPLFGVSIGELVRHP